MVCKVCNNSTCSSNNCICKNKIVIVRRSRSNFNMSKKMAISKACQELSTSKRFVSRVSIGDISGNTII